jgi:hypothetical protein
MSKFCNPQHQGWEMSKFAALSKTAIQRNPYPVGSTAWEDYERGVQYHREGRTWEGEGGRAPSYYPSY